MTFVTHFFLTMMIELLLTFFNIYIHTYIHTHLNETDVLHKCCLNSTGSPFIASVKDVSSTADSGVCLQSGICVSTNTDTHSKYLYFFLKLNVSNTRSHVYTFGAGTEVPEIKYSGDGIYRSSPPPSMEDADSFIDPQRPCGSSRLDCIFFSM